AGDEALYLVDLRRSIVFAQRSAPDDADAELLRGLLPSGVNALPEDVRGAFRNHRDRQRAGFLVRPAAAGGEQRHERRDNPQATLKGSATVARPAMSTAGSNSWGSLFSAAGMDRHDITTGLRFQNRCAFFPRIASRSSRDNRNTCSVTMPIVVS